MKSVFYLSTLCFVIGGLNSSCNNPDKKAQDSIQAALEMNDSVAVVDKKDAEFMVNAASGSMMEVELGKIAQTNSSDKSVKDFANMLISDHSRAGEDLKSLASSRNVILPRTMGRDHQKHVDRLKNLKGREFDAYYISMMVKDHKDDVKKFEDASKGAKDADIKAFAGETLPALRLHLDSARAIRKLMRPGLDSEDIVVPP